jgi:hypothetical protein
MSDIDVPRAHQTPGNVRAPRPSAESQHHFSAGKPTMFRFRPLTIGVIIALAVVALQALLVPLFAGPAANLQPRNLPIAVAGPPPATAALKSKLETAHPGAFDILTVPDTASADASIKDRSVYGAIVLAGNDVTMHVASAGSPAVAALLTQVAADLGPAPVIDVVPSDPGAPQGTGFGTAFLPLAISALLAAALMFLLVRGRTARIGGLLTFGVLAGLVSAAVQQYWLGMLPGDYSSNAAAIALLALAIAATITGLGALLDRGGIILGVLLIFLVGNALSAVTTAPELLPQPWGTLGHYLPIGSGATLLRSVAYFAGSGATPEAAALIAYAIGGLVLTWTGRRGLSPHPAPGAQERERETVLVG